MNERWDSAALKAGGSVALMFAAPFQIAAKLLDDNDPGNGLIVPLVLLTILGFVLGGGVAAWRQQRGTPLSHGIAASAGTFIVVQTVFVIVRLIRGDEVGWLGIFFNLTVAVFAGMIGGLLGISLQKRGMEPRR